MTYKEVNIMYLFRTVDDKVEVYELTPKEDEIKSYKEKQLSLLDRKKRFMEHTTNREKLYSKDGIVHCGSFNKNDPKDENDPQLQKAIELLIK